MWTDQERMKWDIKIWEDRHIINQVIKNFYRLVNAYAARACDGDLRQYWVIYEQETLGFEENPLRTMDEFFRKRTILYDK